jgi:hypothetical protein
MLCAKDYADKLLVELWPAVGMDRVGAGTRAAAALDRIGCNHALPSLAIKVSTWRRALTIPAGLRLGDGPLRKLLADLAEVSTTVGDWPYDYLDVEAKLYKVEWLTSERYHWWLCCLWLCGAVVPMDVACDMARLQVRSRLQTRWWATSLGVYHPRMMPDGMDA